jgi:Histidine kinase-, DNA gyrase B-, and HSP90-like ATPase
MQLNTRSPKSGNIKIALLVAAFFIIIPILFYTHNLVNKLQQKEEEVARLYARSVEYLANSPYNGADYSFIFDEIIRAIDFPIIETDQTGNEIKSYRNVVIDSTLSEDQQTTLLRSMVRQMDSKNSPIVVAYHDTVISLVHYGESPLVTELRWLPYIEISIGALFVLIGYIGFSYIKRSEQSNIWVGMARETAHQLGTPLSSLMGWIEILKLRTEADRRAAETVHEMESDLQRLNKVAERFSKIGSRPDFKQEDITSIVGSVVGYFQKRIPQMGKKVDLHVEGEGSVSASVNRELFEWVIENLVKNALDAMEDGRGTIQILISSSGNSAVIDITDTGKGIDLAYKKDIFRPGFSTKKRGWGLGLSLSQRIIESYHHGKLFVKESRVGVGTTFRIVLKR